MSFRLPILLFIPAILAGCATPTVVEREQPKDSRLDCRGLEREMADAEAFRKKAQKEKGVTGTNVAAAIFFWPAMLGTYANAEEAIDAAEERKLHLMKIYEDKGCVGK